MLRRAKNAYRFVATYRQHLPFAFEAIFSMPCAVTKLRGAIKGGDELITVLYVGRRMNYPYLLRTIFDEHHVQEEEHSSLLTFRKYMDKMAKDSDVIIVDLGWPYNGVFNRTGKYLEIPDWMNMVVELADDWDGVVRSFRHTTRNNDLRIIRRNDYRFEVSNERRLIEQFYDDMYIPYVTSRHKGDSVFAPRKHVIRQAKQGKLLHVLRGEQLVAAGVVFPGRDILYFLWMGLPPDCLDRPPEGAISALYYFGIKYAFDNDYKAVDFTGTRPFLNDGAFRFKRKWGALVEDTFSPSSILVKPKNNNENAARFCERFPVLARNGNDLEARFLYRDETVDEDTLDRLSKQYGCDGVDRMTVVEIADENETRSMQKDPDGCQYRLIKCRMDSFADHYARRTIDPGG